MESYDIRKMRPCFGEKSMTTPVTQVSSWTQHSVEPAKATVETDEIGRATRYFHQEPKSASTGKVQEKTVEPQRSDTPSNRYHTATRGNKQPCPIRVYQAPISQPQGPNVEAASVPTTQRQKQDSIANFADKVPPSAPLSSRSTSLDNVKPSLSSNENEKSHSTRQPGRFVAKTRGRSENFRQTMIEKVSREIEIGLGNFVDNTSLESFLDDSIKATITEFRQQCGNVAGVDREADKLKEQLSLSKMRYRNLNAQKVADVRMEMTKRIQALQSFYQDHLWELLDLQDIISETWMTSDIQRAENFVLHFNTKLERFKKEFSNQPSLVETQLQLLAQGLHEINASFAVHVEEHNLGIEMENLKTDVQNKYKYLTDHVKALEDIEAAHLTAVKNIEETFRARKQVYKFAGMPAFIEDLKRAKVAQLEQKCRFITAELDRMQVAALEKYSELMKKELGVSRPVAKPVIACLHKEYQKLVTAEFEEAFIEIRNDIKNAPQQLARCLGLVDARLGEMYREFEVNNDKLWIQYEKKVARALTKCKQFCAVEIEKVEQHDGHSTVENVLAAAEMKFDDAADLRLFEPRCVTDARDQLLNFKILVNADDSIEDQVADDKAMEPTTAEEPELLNDDHAKDTSVPETVEDEEADAIDNTPPSKEIQSEIPEPGKLDTDKSEPEAPGEVSTHEHVCESGISFIEELDENSSVESSQDSFEVIEHLLGNFEDQEDYAEES